MEYGLCPAPVAALLFGALFPEKANSMSPPRTRRNRPQKGMAKGILKGSRTPLDSGANSMRRKRRLPKTLTKDEVQRLLAAPNITCPTGLRNRCILELMYRGGLRVGEVVRLRPRDVDLAGGSIRIWDGKGGDGTAYFQTDAIAPLLELWKATRRALPKSELLFVTLKGGPVSVRYVEAMFQRMRRRAKIDTPCTPHTLRHTFATELLDEGFTIREVQNALRHADLSTTEIYTHVLDSNLRAKMQTRK